MPPPVVKPRRNWWPLIAVLAGIGGLVLGCGFGAAVLGSDPESTTVAVSPSPVYVTVDVQAEPTTTTAAPATTTTKPKPTKTKVQITDEGMLLVPSEVKPGVYRATVPDGEHCYWARLKSLDGSFGSIIDNANGDPGQKMTTVIKASDKAFETHGCGTWVKIG